MSRAFLELLRSNVLVLIRQRKHLVWRHEASGRNSVTAKTPSSRRADIAIRTRLRRFLSQVGVAS